MESEELLVSTDRWRREHAGSAAAAISFRNLSATPTTPVLTELKRALETSLRAKYGEVSRSELLTDPTLAAYERYDRQFGQSYHVAMQIRSIAQKGKSIPDRNSIIEAMFMTEVSTGVLAAVQDLDAITLPITIDGTDGTESYTRYDGVEEHCKAGDQLMRDATGAILTSIAQGPTNVGLVTDQTTSAIYCFYFPVGVSVETQADALEYLHKCVLAGNPDAVETGRTILNADQASGSR